MPRIKRWHPVSHDFVRDPEVIELRRRFGDWAGLFWLEMLSVADRNDGYIKGNPENLSRWSRIVWVESSQEVLADMTTRQRELSKWSAQRARKILEWMAEKRWIIPKDSAFYIRNYPEYHKMKGKKKSQMGVKEAPPLPSEPSYPSELPKQTQKVPSADPAQPAGSAPPSPDNGFDPDTRNWLLATKHLKPLAEDQHADFWLLLVEAYDRYPWLYFEEQIKKADAWMESNPSRAPTPRGLRRFMRSWMEKAVEIGRKQHG